MANSISSNLFNATIASSAIAGASEIGLLQKIDREGSVIIDEFCKQNNLQEYPFRVLLKSLSSFEIISLNSDIVTKSKYFDDIFRNKGYFTWLIKGYAYSLENIDLLLEEDELMVSNIRRNGKFIAKAGKDYGANFVDAHFLKIFNNLNPKNIVDIGCGSADRLISIIQNNKNIRGIGIDSNPDAVALAKQNIVEANLESSISVVCADIRNLKAEKQFGATDLLFSFFMGHDLFPKENCFSVFNNFSKVFPNADTFLLCDTFQSENTEKEYPIFTLGFELSHALMGQVIPTYNDWLQLFKELNWKLASTTNVEIASSAIFTLKLK